MTGRTPDPRYSVALVLPIKGVGAPPTPRESAPDVPEESMPGGGGASIDSLETPRSVRRKEELQRVVRRAACCCYLECLRPLHRFAPAVRGIVVLMVLEAACAISYGGYIAIIVAVEDLTGREELFGAGALVLFAAALVLFVVSAVLHENTAELAAANVVSVCLCTGPLFIMFRPPEGAGWGRVVELSKSVDSRLRVTFAVLAAAFGFAFAIVSVFARREFSWKNYLQYGDKPEKLLLASRLQRFYCLWKLDVMLCTLCLLAVWAFLFTKASLGQVLGGCALCVANFMCSAAMYWAVRLEVPRLAFALQPLAVLQPLFLVAMTVDIVIQLFILRADDQYEDVWPSVMIPSLLLAALVRIGLMASTMQLVISVFGRGLKGRDPFATKEDELAQLPRQVRRKLKRRKDLQEALRFCMRGQQLKCSAALTALPPPPSPATPSPEVPGGAVAVGNFGGTQPGGGGGMGDDLRNSFVQLSPSLEELLLPWLGVAVPIGSVLHINCHSAFANAPRRASDDGSGSSSSRSRAASHEVRTSHAVGAVAAGLGAKGVVGGDAEADGFDRLGFALWYLDGDRPLQIKFMAHDEDSLWSWVQGLRAALPDRDTVPMG